MDRISEIQARLAAINTELESADEARYAELEAESRNLLNELDGLKKTAKDRQELRSKIAAGLTGATTETHKEEKKMEERTFTLESEEYRSAFLKNLRGEDLTEVEQRAFTFLTTNTTAPLPTVMLNQIIDLIGEAHPIVADTYELNSGSAISIPVGKAITADAGKTAEGADHNDLQVTFTNVDLSGEDYTAEIRTYVSKMIGGTSERAGCVEVDARLAELLQMLMSKYTFQNVDNAWTKLCYYYQYIGAPKNP